MPQPEKAQGRQSQLRHDQSPPAFGALGAGFAAGLRVCKVHQRKAERAVAERCRLHNVGGYSRHMRWVWIGI